MSIRQMFPGSIVKPGFNPLAAQTPTILYNLFSWGLGGFGDLGLGNTASYSSPKQVGNLTDWLVLSAGSYTTAAVKSDGTLWTWGKNTYGQLGLGNTTNYSSPKQVGALTNWSTVSIGGLNTYPFLVAVKTDGTLWACGRNNLGQLGLGNTTSYSSPKQVGALTAWLKVACGHYYTMAVKTDGTMWAWGQNNSGQLGLGNLTNYSSPKQVGALTNWLNVSAGAYVTQSVKTDGTLWTWGNSSFGALGLGNTTGYSSPKQVGALTNWRITSPNSNYSTYALKTNNELWTWGYNGSGQLGTSNTTNYSSPKQIGGMSTCLNISAGYNSVYVVKTDGTLWSWGLNDQGQLGNGNTTNSTFPIQIGVSTTWVNPAGGNRTAFARG